MKNKVYALFFLACFGLFLSIVIPAQVPTILPTNRVTTDFTFEKTLTVDGAVSFGSTLAVTGAISAASGFVVGDSTPFSDSSGVLTLQNVDALDATTEATTEAAIDALPNISGEIDFNGTGSLDNIKTATFIAEVAQTPSSAFTVDWTAGQKQRVTITGTNLDITFTNPDGPCNLMLIVVQGDGDDTIDWTNEADILFPGGTDPTLSTGSGDVDVVSFYFDGTNYLGQAALDFS